MLNQFFKFIKWPLVFYSFFLVMLISMALPTIAWQVKSQRGELPRHHVAGGFRNLHIDAKGRRGDFFRWRFGFGPKEEPALKPDTVPAYHPQMLTPDLNCLNHADPRNIQITWIGHDTFLIQVAGLNILTDPIFSDRASPFSFTGPKRSVPPPMRQDELPPIQATVISHNHYDHLDKASVPKSRE